MERRGKPLPVHLLETYRRLIKYGLPTEKERLARKGLTKSEIARLTGTSRTTVKKYLPSLIEQEERKRNRTPPPENGQMPDGVP
jgi:DNA invertase Pin-like site-specific DNA recombinase